MGIDLYYLPLSAPCRAVMMAAKNLGIELNLKMTNIMAGEHMKSEFLKMNPQHTIPTMDDNGFYMFESRAIMQYLANKHGRDGTLYPKDSKKRGLIDMRLYFDLGTLYHRFGDAYYPVVFHQQGFDTKKLQSFNEALELLNGYVADGFSAGPQLTIADFTIMATLSTAEACGHDLSEFPNIVAYMEKCKVQIKGYNELNQQGADQFGEIAKNALKKV